MRQSVPNTGWKVLVNCISNNEIGQLLYSAKQHPASDNKPLNTLRWCQIQAPNQEVNYCFSGYGSTAPERLLRLFQYNAHNHCFHPAM
mgnify:FL=1